MVSKRVSMDKSTKNATRTTENLEERVSTLEKENEELAAQLKWYQEQFRLSQKQRFGSSSEKTDPDQIELPLFNEAEVTQDQSVEEPTVETITYDRKKTRKSRKTTTENLPSETVEYDLPAEEQVCSCCNGDLHKMSQEVREEIKVIPAEVKVVKHVRHVYACRSCEKNGTTTPVVTADMPESVFPGSLASPSAMAYIMEQKYVQGLPLYRQEKQFDRLGVHLSRQTLSNWLMYGAETWLAPVYSCMVDKLKTCDVLHADETTLQVLNEPGRPAMSKSYMWLYRTGRSDPPIVVFDYKTTRASKHPRQFLNGFKGYLHVDGYAGYNAVGSEVQLVGCWAHARRKFDEAVKALPKSEKQSTTAAQEGLAYCNKLFEIERELKELNLPYDQVYKMREKRSRPVLEAFSGWLKKMRPKILPKSLLGNAITYCLNQMDRLQTFLKDGRLEIDNNLAERTIKPFVIGRKNWLFSNTARGAEASSIIYSVIETAKENGLNPFQYLTYLFEILPNIKASDIDRLLPWSTELPDYVTRKSTSTQA